MVFYIAASLVLWVYEFCSLMSHIALKSVAFLYFGLSLWRVNSIMSVPACLFHPYDTRPISLHIYFTIMVHPFLIGIYIQNISCSLTVDVIFCWFHCECILFGIYAEIVVWAYLRFCFCCWIHRIHCRWIFKYGYMVNSLKQSGMTSFAPPRANPSLLCLFNSLLLQLVRGLSAFFSQNWQKKLRRFWILDVELSHTRY